MQTFLPLTVIPVPEADRRLLVRASLFADGLEPLDVVVKMQGLGAEGEPGFLVPERHTGDFDHIRKASAGAELLRVDANRAGYTQRGDIEVPLGTFGAVAAPGPTQQTPWVLFNGTYYACEPVTPQDKHSKLGQGGR